MALRAVEGKLAALQPPASDWSLVVRKADLLVDLKKYEEAQKLLTGLESQDLDEELLQRARLVKAKMHMARKEPERAFALCQEVALNCRSTALRTSALQMMGQYYEHKGAFDGAALAYAGRCPLSAEGGR